MDGADCCLIGIILGVTMKKVSPNNNTTQYLQILPSTQLPNRPMPPDTGLTAADAWAVADDRSTWRALRPTAGYAQH